MTVWMSLIQKKKKTTLKTIILKIKLKSWVKDKKTNIENVNLFLFFYCVANKNNLNILEITFFFC